MDVRVIPRLNRFERALIGLLACGVVAFGIVVEIRSALQKVRRTDFGVYARAGWAARNGIDPFTIEDDRGWHYCYPPAFAAAMIPLADPPADRPRTGYFPFEIAVGLWYLLGVASAMFAVDRFASAVLPDEPRFSRRWWYARTGPFTVALGAIGHTLARGQVNLAVVALVAATFAELTRRRSFAAGLWLGAAACIKVIPAYLALYFVVKRDRRGLAGLAAALAIGFGIVPLAVWGPDAAIVMNRQLLVAVLQPGATGHGDRTRAVELTNATATDSQSFLAFLHNGLHADRFSRPAEAAPETRLAHWIVGGIFTLAILMAFRRFEANPANDLIRIGALGAVMLHLTPVSHMHYYAFALPLVCGVWLRGLRDRPDRVAPAGLTFVALVFWGVATALPLFDFPLADTLRAHGAGLAATYVLLRAALARPDQSSISAGWPSRSPRMSVRAAVFTRSDS